MKLYKVLDSQGSSFHGGTLKWSLPTADAPGEWHEVKGKIELCSKGLHLTREPARWMDQGAQIFEAEYDGKLLGEDDAEKVCVQRARLVRRIDDPNELAAMHVYLSGRHEMTDGYAWVSGNAVLTASGKSHVVARESSHVVARESSHVVAWESSHVVARESSHVVARESSHVDAWGSSHVDAWESSHVVAWESSHVVARESSHVVARESSHVDAWGSSHVDAWGSSTLTTKQQGWDAHHGPVAMHGPLAVWIKRHAEHAEIIVGTGSAPTETTPS